MDEQSVDHGSPSDRVTIQRRIIRSSGNHAEMSRIAKNVAIEPMNDSILCIDQTCGIFSDSLKLASRPVCKFQGLLTPILIQVMENSENNPL